MDDYAVTRSNSEGKSGATDCVIGGGQFHQTISKDEDIIHTATSIDGDINGGSSCQGCGGAGVISSNQGVLLSIQSGLLSSADRLVSVRGVVNITCLLYTSPSPRDVEESRMPSSA